MPEQKAILEAVRRGMIPMSQARELLGAEAPPVESDIMDPNQQDPKSMGEYLSRLWGNVKAGATGLATGVAGATVALPKNLMDLADLGISKATGTKPGIPDAPGHVLPSSGDVANAMNKAGMYHVARTPAEGYTQAGAAGLGSMVNPFDPFKMTKALGALGAVSGVAGEAADNIFDHEPWARPAANLAAMTPGAVKFKTPQATSAIKGAVGDIGNETLDAAAVAKANADKTLGVNTLLTHQLPQNSPLVAYAARIAQDPEGGAIRSAVAGENAAMNTKAQDLVGGLSDSTLGSAAENQVNAAGVGATYKTPENAARIASAADYLKANKERIPDTDPIVAAIMRAQQAKNATGGPSGQAIKTVIGAVDKLKEASGADGIKIAELDNLAKTYTDAGYNPGSEGMAQQRARGYQVAGDALTQSLREASPALNEAKDTFGAAREAFVNPVQEGPLSKIFKNREGDQGNFGQQTSILSNRYNPSDIADFAQRLTVQDPAAFPIIMKKAAVDAMDKADSFPSFVEELAGKGPTQQRANFLEGIKQTGLAHGMSPEDAVAASTGANNLLDVFSKVGTGGENLAGPMDTTAFSQAAGESAPTKMLKILPNPFQGKDVVRTWSMANMIDKVVRQHTYDQLADIFTSPDGLAKLKDIAQYSPVDNAGAILGRALTSTSAQSGAATLPDTAVAPPQ